VAKLLSLQLFSVHSDTYVIVRVNTFHFLAVCDKSQLNQAVCLLCAFVQKSYFCIDGDENLLAHFLL